ncbi:hypothetical protein [Litorimonas haliclonae]|uniref:hypothetical protein n=1 Tax=Litorimonas haliclonae TaxID=2081977 RepID=UPI0039F10A6D
MLNKIAIIGPTFLKGEQYFEKIGKRLDCAVSWIDTSSNRNEIKTHFLRKDISINTHTISSFDLILYFPRNYSSSWCGLYSTARDESYIHASWEPINDYLSEILANGPTFNCPKCAKAMSNNLISLRLAVAHGLEVVPWICTNTAKNIPKSFGDKLIIKSAGYHNEVSSGEFIPTSVVEKDDLDETLSEVPIIIQPYIKTAKELRIYSFPHRTIVTEYEKVGEIIDIRFSQECLDTLEVTQEHQKLSDQIRCFLNDVGLLYAAVDVLVDSGTYGIIDINPHGTWDTISNASISYKVTECFYEAFSDTELEKNVETFSGIHRCPCNNFLTDLR